MPLIKNYCQSLTPILREHNKITSGVSLLSLSRWGTSFVQCIALADIPNTEVWAFEKKVNCFGVRQTDLI